MERGQTGATGTRVLSRAAEEHKDEKDPAPTPPLNMAAPTVPGVQTLLKLATPILAQVRLSMGHMNTKAQSMGCVYQILLEHLNNCKFTDYLLCSLLIYMYYVC